jgi:hypothetical protein
VAHSLNSICSALFATYSRSFYIHRIPPADIAFLELRDFGISNFDHFIQEASLLFLRYLFLLVSFDLPVPKIMSFSNFLTKLSKQPPTYERKVHFPFCHPVVHAFLTLYPEELQIRKDIRYVNPSPPPMLSCANLVLFRGWNVKLTRPVRVSHF